LQKSQKFLFEELMHLVTKIAFVVPSAVVFGAPGPEHTVLVAAVVVVSFELVTAAAFAVVPSASAIVADAAVAEVAIAVVEETASVELQQLLLSLY
jgi:hypothetical protein